MDSSRFPRGSPVFPSYSNSDALQGVSLSDAQSYRLHDRVVHPRLNTSSLRPSRTPSPSFPVCSQLGAAWTTTTTGPTSDPPNRRSSMPCNSNPQTNTRAFLPTERSAASSARSSNVERLSYTGSEPLNQRSARLPSSNPHAAMRSNPSSSMSFGVESTHPQFQSHEYLFSSFYDESPIPVPNASSRSQPRTGYPVRSTPGSRSHSPLIELDMDKYCTQDFTHGDRYFHTKEEQGVPRIIAPGAGRSFQPVKPQERPSSCPPGTYDQSGQHHLSRPGTRETASTLHMTASHSQHPYPPQRDPGTERYHLDSRFSQSSASTATRKSNDPLGGSEDHQTIEYTLHQSPFPSASRSQASLDQTGLTPSRSIRPRVLPFTNDSSTTPLTESTQPTPIKYPLQDPNLPTRDHLLNTFSGNSLSTMLTKENGHHESVHQRRKSENSYGSATKYATIESPWMSPIHPIIRDEEKKSEYPARHSRHSSDGFRIEPSPSAARGSESSRNGLSAYHPSQPYHPSRSYYDYDPTPAGKETHPSLPSKEKRPVDHNQRKSDRVEAERVYGGQHGSQSNGIHLNVQNGIHSDHGSLNGKKKHTNEDDIASLNASLNAEIKAPSPTRSPSLSLSLGKYLQPDSAGQSSTSIVDSSPEPLPDFLADPLALGYPNLPRSEPYSDMPLAMDDLRDVSQPKRDYPRPKSPYQPDLRNYPQPKLPYQPDSAQHLDTAIHTHPNPQQHGFHSIATPKQTLPSNTTTMGDVHPHIPRPALTISSQSKSSSLPTSSLPTSSIPTSSIPTSSIPTSSIPTSSLPTSSLPTSPLTSSFSPSKPTMDGYPTPSAVKTPSIQWTESGRVEVDPKYDASSAYGLPNPLDQEFRNLGDHVGSTSLQSSANGQYSLVSSASSGPLATSQLSKSQISGVDANTIYTISNLFQHLERWKGEQWKSDQELIEVKVSLSVKDSTIKRMEGEMKEMQIWHGKYTSLQGAMAEKERQLSVALQDKEQYLLSVQEQMRELQKSQEEVKEWKAKAEENENMIPDFDPVMAEELENEIRVRVELARDLAQKESSLQALQGELDRCKIEQEQLMQRLEQQRNKHEKECEAIRSKNEDQLRWSNTELNTKEDMIKQLSAALKEKHQALGDNRKALEELATLKGEYPKLRRKFDEQEERAGEKIRMLSKEIEKKSSLVKNQEIELNALRRTNEDLRQRNIAYDAKVVAMENEQKEWEKKFEGTDTKWEKKLKDLNKVLSEKDAELANQKYWVHSVEQEKEIQRKQYIERLAEKEKCIQEWKDAYQEVKTLPGITEEAIQQRHAKERKVLNEVTDCLAQMCRIRRLVHLAVTGDLNVSVLLANDEQAEAEYQQAKEWVNGDGVGGLSILKKQLIDFDAILQARHADAVVEGCITQ